MILSDVARVRLVNQQIEESTFRTPSELVSWMGALQGQDGNMVKWAMGVRLPDYTEAQITHALDSGELVRTHLLRPTWHIVAAQDIYWLLDVTAPHVKTLLKSSLKSLEISEELIVQSHTIIEKALIEHTYLTRGELMLELQKSSIRTDENRSAHLMMRAELDGIVCNGPINGKQITYALLEERIPKPPSLTREEGLAKLAYTYFSSHGPATILDFVWWSGLSVTDARRALEMIKSDLNSELIGNQTYWFRSTLRTGFARTKTIHLLPAFDEYTVSYKDRSAVLSAEDQKQAISANGIFSPIIVLDGQIIGVWKRVSKKEKAVIEPVFFKPVDSSIVQLLAEAIDPYSRFLGQPVEIAYRV
ncbi:winged helix DNA-binding domain-containing protein [Spirosoma harenae]